MGAAGSNKFESFSATEFASASISARLLSAALTLLANSLAFSSKAVFSSPLAPPTAFERVFCSARSASNSLIAARRFSSSAKT